MALDKKDDFLQLNLKTSNPHVSWVQTGIFPSFVGRDLICVEITWNMFMNGVRLTGFLTREGKIQDCMWASLPCHNP